MLTHPLVAKFKNFGGQSIQEVSIVRHQDERAIKSLEGILDDVLSLHVEVVGRFIENQKIDRLQKELDHSQTGFFTTRKHLHFFVDVVAFKHEGSEDILDFGSDFSYG